MFENITTAQAFLLFAIVESIQMAFLVYNSRETNKLIHSLIHDPDIAGKVILSALFGFMSSIQQDKEKERVFFSFINTMAVNGAMSIKQYMYGKGQETPLWKKSDPVGSFFNMFGGTLKEKFMGAGEKAVEKAADKAVEVWE